jgi:very-short-patch-repair endonuclease
MERRRNTNIARKLRRSMTDAETRIWHHLRDRRLLGFKFRRQMPIGNYVVDFACADARLITELDGGQHIDAAEKDARRTEELAAPGFCVLRFWNDDVLLRLEDVLEQIIAALRKSVTHEQS